MEKYLDTEGSFQHTKIFDTSHPCTMESQYDNGDIDGAVLVPSIQCGRLLARQTGEDTASFKGRLQFVVLVWPPLKVDAGEKTNTLEGFRRRVRHCGC